jgi:hypothetical protein
VTKRQYARYIALTTPEKGVKAEYLIYGLFVAGLLFKLLIG